VVERPPIQQSRSGQAKSGDEGKKKLFEREKETLNVLEDKTVRNACGKSQAGHMQDCVINMEEMVRQAK
jgi:hypothetical protein